MDAAIAAPLTRHHRDNPGGVHINTGHRGEAPAVLAEAFAGDDSADRWLLGCAASTSFGLDFTRPLWEDGLLLYHRR